VAHASGTISLLHYLPPYAEARARQLGLKRSAYLCILLSNYLHGPSFGLPHIDPDKKLKRVLMQLTMPLALRKEGQKAAARWHLSFSSLMESLIIYDARREDDAGTLVIHPVSTKPSPRLRGW